MKSAFWVGLVLLFTIYIMAIFCVNYIGRDGAMYSGYTTDPEEIDYSEVIKNFNPYLAFGSMPKSMLTLFNIATLAEWPEIIRPLMVKQPLYPFFFCLYVIFITFGAMNVIV